MLNKKSRRIIGCLAVISLTWGMIVCMANITKRKSSDIKYEDFYEEKQDYDILFMGTSHVMNAVFPMELWNDYGITSYNFGNDSSTLPTTYWVMLNALDYTTPKLMVIDCYGLGNNTKVSTANFGYAHVALDSFPLSLTKVKAALDLTNDPQREEMIENGDLDVSQRGSALELLWPFSVYHSRWNQLTNADFHIPYSCEKGADYRIGLAQPVESHPPSKNKMGNAGIGLEYLKRIIEECQSRNIEILLTYLPYPAVEASWREANTAAETAAAYQVDYLNLLDAGIVDFNIDLYDPVSHLNPAGARKMTDYLGSYILNHFDIKDKRTDPNYSSWLEDYDVYTDFKIDRLKRQKNTDLYLMLLNDDSFEYEMEITNGSRLFQEEPYCLLLNQIKKLGRSIIKVSDPSRSTAGFDARITVIDKRNGEIVDWVEVSKNDLLRE